MNKSSWTHGIPATRIITVLTSLRPRCYNAVTAIICLITVSIFRKISEVRSSILSYCTFFFFFFFSLMYVCLTDKKT